MTATNKIYFYPIWLRIWHALNAVGIIILIITGIAMQSNFFSSFIGFQTAITLHNISGGIVTLSYFIVFKLY